MQKESAIILKIQFLEHVLKMFQPNPLGYKNEEDLRNDVVKYIRDSGFFPNVEVEKDITVVVNDHNFHWRPDILLKDMKDNQFFVELKYSSRLLDYSRIISNLSAILDLKEVRNANVLGGVLACFIPKSDVITTCPIYRLDESSGVEIYSKEIKKGVTIAIFKVDVNSKSPSELLDTAVGQFVGSKAYNQYRDIYNDNPWTRIIICGENNLDFQPFVDQKA